MACAVAAAPRLAPFFLAPLPRGRGLTISGGGAKAVGNAVNETVVYAFMALFVINVVVTAVGIQMTAK